MESAGGTLAVFLETSSGFFSAYISSGPRTMKEVDFHPRRRQRGSYISALSPSTRQQSDITQTILHFEETVSNSKYSEFNPGWGSVISRECGVSEEALGSFSLLLENGL